MLIDTFKFSDSVFGFIINSSIDSRNLGELEFKIDEVLNLPKKISIYIEEGEQGDVAYSTLIQHFKWKLKHKNSFDRIAFVSNNSVLKLLVKIETWFLIKAKTKTFDRKQRATALSWVSLV